MSANLENSAVATELEKVSFHSNPQEGGFFGNAKECSNLHSFHMLARLCSKSFKIGFSSTPKNFEMYQLGLEKAEEPEIKLPTIIGSWKKQGNSRKKIYPLLLH